MKASATASSTRSRNSQRLITDFSSQDQRLAVLSKDTPQAVRDLADRRPGQDRVDHRRDQVLAAAGPGFESLESDPPRRRVTPRPQSANAFPLRSFELRVDPQDVVRRPLHLLLETIHAHDHALARLDLALVAKRRFLDRALHV